MRPSEVAERGVGALIHHEGQPPRIPQKQSVPDQSVWWEALRNIEHYISREHIDRLVDQAAEEVRRTTKGMSVAFGWSGGKDSQALEYVMRAAGVTDCVLVISELEYPEFLQWCTDHMPERLEVRTQPLDLDWLAANQDTHLFPQGRYGSDWFRKVQHTGCREYYEDYDLDCLILGRRKADGNYTQGRSDGVHIYTTNNGHTRYAPIYDWSHEETFAAIYYYQDLDLAPCYWWPRGFQVGTGPWPARQWTESERHGWREVWEIDHHMVLKAAGHGGFPGAMTFLEEEVMP